MSAPWLQRGAELVRAVIGAPSYERYLAHMLAAHPGRAPLGRDDFIRTRLEARYSKPGARCC
ncbi:MAG: YbdD/YjiX family protein [Gemmatimonadaceae bacterium]